MTKPFPSDLEIAQAATLEPITEIAAENGISADRLEPYGKYVAKVLLDETTNAETARKRGSKYIVVTAVTPTPLGEGKTATSVSLAQGFAQTGRKAILALRQPAMGPTFGIKGGAAGGGYALPAGNHISAAALCARAGTGRVVGDDLRGLRHGSGDVARAAGTGT